MSITAQSKVGELASVFPLATRVFTRHGIDFCCGGGKALAAVCADRGLDVATIIAEIEQTASTPADSDVDWASAPLTALIEHILTRYHESLYSELPELEAMARKVVRVHHDKAPERFDELLEVFMALKLELEQHMVKEEQILFPMVRAGQGRRLAAPISVMEAEHDSAGDALKRLRVLTDDYTPPAEACNTWRALWARLGTLERDLHLHIHLENNILFPRALRGEQ